MLESENRIHSIPIVTDLSAALGFLSEENVEEYLSLHEDESKGAHFGVRVIGDSMKDDGILPGDIALIRQQPWAAMGEIVAVVITTAAGSEGVLRRYYPAYEFPQDMRHWLLISSNPTSSHLVLIPKGADVAAIKALYGQGRRSGRIRNPMTYFEDTELAIAGKLVGLVRYPRTNYQRVQIPLPKSLTVDDYFDSVLDTLKALEFVYSVLAILNSGEAKVITNLARFCTEQEDPTAISNRRLHRFLAAAAIEPLRLISVTYGSAASFDFLGVGKVLELLSDSVKDLVWRGKHEIQMAELERKQKEAEIEKIRVETAQAIAETIEKVLLSVKTATHLELPVDEQEAISFALESWMIKIVNAPVAPILTDERVVSVLEGGDITLLPRGQDK